MFAGVAATASPTPGGTTPDPEQVPVIITPTPTPAPVNAKKRKRGVKESASSPAPSDPGQNNTSEVIISRVDLSSRRQLSISRGPQFAPVADLDGTEYFKTELTGVNRVGFRYSPAGINPAGFATPCRTIETDPTSYRVSWEDRSPFVHVTKDGLGLLGTKGFRSARCNAPIREGKWYVEVKVVHGGGERVSEDSRREGAHVRLGWGRREAPLNGPVGLDGYSYGYRDKTGDKVTLSRPRSYGRPYGSGDVIGMYISLPPRRQPNKDDPHDPAHLKRERIPIDLKGQEVFEMLEYPQSKEMISLMEDAGKSTNAESLPSATSKKAEPGKLPERGSKGSKHNKEPELRHLPILEGSRVAFFVNGESQGLTFRDLYDYLPLRTQDTGRKGRGGRRVREGVREHKENPFDDGTLGYFPFISLFNSACVRINPGPDFDFPPPDDVDALLDNTTSSEDGRTWQPICERYKQFMEEQWELDRIEEEEAKIEAVRLAKQEKEDAENGIVRGKKRRTQAERTRKRAAKKGSTEPRPTPPRATSVESERSERATPFGLLGPGQPSPSPLRYASTPWLPESTVDTPMSNAEASVKHEQLPILNEPDSAMEPVETPGPQPMEFKIEIEQPT